MPITEPALANAKIINAKRFKDKIKPSVKIKKEIFKMLLLKSFFNLTSY